MARLLPGTSSQFFHHILKTFLCFRSLGAFDRVKDGPFSLLLWCFRGLQNGDAEKFSIYVHSKPGFIFDASTTRSSYFYGRQLRESVRVCLFFMLSFLCFPSLASWICWELERMVMVFSQELYDDSEACFPEGGVGWGEHGRGWAPAPPGCPRGSGKPAVCSALWTVGSCSGPNYLFFVSSLFLSSFLPSLLSIAQWSDWIYSQSFSDQTWR